MAIALVTGQTLKVESGSGTSWTASFAGNVTTGNLLSCFGCGYSGTPANFTVHDTNNATGVWTQRAISVTNSPTSSVGAYCKNCTGGTTPTVTFDAGTGATGGTAFAQEWSGCDATTPFTAGESGSGSGAIDGTHTTSSATNTTNANSVYVGGFFTDGAANPEGAQTWNNSWTKDAEETNGTSFQVASVGHLIVTSSSSRQESVTFTHSGGTATWSACFLIFQQAASAAAAPPQAHMSPDMQATPTLFGY
jgi:hypothetical protein